MRKRPASAGRRVAGVADFRFSASTVAFAMGNPQVIMDAFANARNGPWGSGEWRVTSDETIMGGKRCLWK